VLLAIDIGNTESKLGVFQDERLVATWRISSDLHRTSDEYAVLILDLLRHGTVDPKAIKGVALCSSVPPLNQIFEELSRAYFGAEPLVVGAGVKTGMRILYDNPREVGADRITDAVAAYRLYGGPVIVVDLGTATVFDAVSKEGDYLGGAIAPGIVIAAEALFQRTSKLNRVELVGPKHAIGKNTTHAIQSGIMYGYAGLVEGVVQRFQEEMGGGAKVVATGGLAVVVAKETRVFSVVNTELTLQGLKYIYELNHSAPLAPRLAGAGAQEEQVKG